MIEPMVDTPAHLPKQPPFCFLLGAGERPEVMREAQGVRPVVEQFAHIVRTDFTGAVDLSNVEADVAIVLGGDGSILRAAHQMGVRQVPVIAINLGKLGFLANLTPEELPDVLRDFAAGSLKVIEHLMFECTVRRRAGRRPPIGAQRDGRPRWHAVSADQRRSLR